MLMMMAPAILRIPPVNKGRRRRRRGHPGGREVMAGAPNQPRRRRRRTRTGRRFVVTLLFGEMQMQMLPQCLITSHPPLGAGQVTHLNQWSGNVVGRGGRSRKSRSLRPAKHYNLGVKVRSIPSSPLHLHLQIGICRLASTCELSHVHVPRRAGIERKSLLASFLNFSSAATSPMVPLPPLHATPVKVPS